MIDNTISSFVTPDPNNPSVRILILGVEGLNGTNRLLKLGTTTAITKKNLNTSKTMNAGAPGQFPLIS